MRVEIELTESETEAFLDKIMDIVELAQLRGWSNEKLRETLKQQSKLLTRFHAE